MASPRSAVTLTPLSAELAPLGPTGVDDRRILAVAWSGEQVVGRQGLPRDPRVSREHIRVFASDDTGEITLHVLSRHGATLRRPGHDDRKLSQGETLSVASGDILFLVDESQAAPAKTAVGDSRPYAGNRCAYLIDVPPTTRKRSSDTQTDDDGRRVQARQEERAQLEARVAAAEAAKEEEAAARQLAEQKATTAEERVAQAEARAQAAEAQADARVQEAETARRKAEVEKFEAEVKKEMLEERYEMLKEQLEQEDADARGAATQAFDDMGESQCTDELTRKQRRRQDQITRAQMDLQRLLGEAYRFPAEYQGKRLESFFDKLNYAHTVCGMDKDQYDACNRVRLWRNKSQHPEPGREVELPTDKEIEETLQECARIKVLLRRRRG